MSVEQAWNDMGVHQDDDLAAMLKEGAIPQFTSKNPLVKLRKNLLRNVLTCIPTTTFFLVAVFIYPVWQAQVILILLFVFSVCYIYSSWQLYKQVDATSSSDRPLLAELKRHHQTIKHWLVMQQWLVLPLYPFACLCGFLMRLGSQENITTFFSYEGVVFIVVVIIIVTTILCFFATRLLSHLFFGRYLIRLRKMIQELEGGQ